MRSGIVTLVGRPNVGKSSLLNALVGRKLSIVSHKPQTTRHAIQGVVHRAEGQIVFVDTPGLHLGGKRALNRAMNEAAANSLHDVDLVVFVVESGRWTEEDSAVLERLGIAAEMKPKTVTRPGGYIARVVASGEAELAVSVPSFARMRAISGPFSAWLVASKSLRTTSGGVPAGTKNPYQNEIS